MFHYIFMMMLIFFPSMVFSVTTTFARLPLPPSAMGPDSFAFDFVGGGPYTGVADGRILKFSSNASGFQDFAFTAPNRSKEVCDGYVAASLARTCGRPLGLGFYNKTGLLYVADAILGLFVAPPNGGQAAQLATGADGVPFRLLDGLEIDQPSGTIYLTDASAVYNISQIMIAVLLNDATGRLLKYEPDTQRITVLLNGLSGPAGVAISLNSDFLLFTEFISGKVKKYWLTGPRATTVETLITFPAGTGRPDNIKRDPSGNYWVAINFQPIPLISQLNFPTAVKINADGRILDTKNLSLEFGVTMISEVQEHEGALYVGSMNTTFVGKYNI